jgi:hypothetical protein
MKKFVFGAVVALLLITLLLPGCSSGNSSTSPGSTTTTKTTTGGKQIVITYVTITAEEFKGAYYLNTPQAGNTYLILDMTIENHSGEPFNVDPLGFSMVANSVKYTRAFVFELENALQLGVVPANGTLTGKLAFEVPLNTANFDMQYKGDKKYNIQWIKQ